MLGGGAVASATTPVKAVTMRAGSSTFAFVVVVAAAVLLLGDALLRGAWPVLAVSAGPAILVIWVAWMLLLHPSIRVFRDRAVIVNVGRITEVPWIRVVDIRRRLQLVFDLEDGDHVEAWGSPFVQRRVFPGRKPLPAGADDPTLAELRAAWMSGNDDMSVASVVRRVDTTALLIGAAAVVACVLSLTLSGSAVAR